MARTRKQKGSSPKNNTKGPQRPEPKSPSPFDNETSIVTESPTHSSSTIDSNDTWDGSVSQTSRSEIEPPHVKQERIPPIIIEPNHWIKAAPKIMTLFPNGKLTAKLIKNNIHALATDSATFRQAQDVLEKAKIPFHTFSLPADRSLKVLLRGIPNNTLVKDVQNELSELGFEITHIRQFLKNGKPLPMYMVTLPCNPTNKNIFNLTSIFYISITVEQYRASGPSQCFNCQNFGHSSANCKHPARCVKCSGAHQTRECSKTAEKPPKCCNCGGEHTANFRQCPVFADQMTLKTKSTNTVAKLPSPTITTNPTPSVKEPSGTNTSYASITTNHSDKTNSKSKDLLTKLLIDTIQKISTSADIKETIMSALSAIIMIIQNV